MIPGIFLPNSHETGCRMTRSNFLSEEMLRSLPTKRLLAVYNKARAVCSSIAYHTGPRCCEFCHEYIGSDWERDVGQYLRPWEKYKELIKEILKLHPHVERGRVKKSGRTPARMNRRGR
jgi:hypothetical protein